MLHTHELSRSFDLGHETVEAVRGIDLDIEPREVVALLGPNGAGKSTTLHMLTTLLPPSAGTATVAGYDVERDPAEVRRRIGFIGQGNGSFDGLRVREELVSQGRFHGLNRRTARTRAAQLLSELELEAQADRDVARLSGGQRRRLDIAMGLIHRPPLVFLDEPSAGLDPQSRANLWGHMARLREEHGTTIVLTTHYLEEADAAADRVVVIDHGQVIADGAPDELKAQTSGDRVAVDLGDGDLRAAAEAAHQVPDVTRVTTDDGLVVHVETGDTALPRLVRALDAADVRIRGTRVLRPSLDDVFLTLTGRNLREDT